MKKHEYVEVIFSKAEENLRAADLCLKHKYYNAATSRCYYACAQLATAALLTQGTTISENPNHREIINKYRQQFSNNLPSIGDSLQTLFDARHEADYKDRNVSSNKAVIWFQEAAKFHSILKNHINRP